MKENRKTLAIIKFLGIFLIAVLFLFGFAGIVHAAPDCSTFSGVSLWQNVNFDCSLTFTDSGGSGLDVCKYEIESFDGLIWVQTDSKLYTIGEGCTGNGPFTPPDITVTLADATGKCRDTNINNCKLTKTTKDSAGNETINIYSYDIDYIAPTVLSFTIDGLSFPTTVNANSALNIVWTSSDTGGAGIQKHEVWRAPFAAGTCDYSNKSGCALVRVIDNAISPETTHSPPSDNTWWYGIHTLDNDNVPPQVNENCITEAPAHCGGVSSDELDPTRTILGPIKVVWKERPSMVNESTVGAM